MPIIAENNSKPRVLVPAGTHIARCVSMIHIGTVPEESGPHAGKLMNKVRISWETPDEQYDFGQGMQPFMVSKEFTLSMNEKANLRKMLEGWRGKAFTEDEAKGFDITKLIGKPCMLSVIHKTSQKGKPYSDISSVTTLPKGIECAKQVNPSTVLSYDAWDQKIYDGLPDYLKTMIRSSREYADMMHPANTEAAAEVVNTANNEDLPF